jgi:GDP-4-dehydro-6-deoxy-D-mannose reductase
MRVLVTGASGFLGGYLLAALRTGGHHAIALTSPRMPGEHPVELTDAEAVTRVLREAEADVAIHLAARAKPAGIEGVRALMTNNVDAALNILEGVRQVVPRTRVIIASSSAVYGAVPRERNPVRETEPIRPVLPYGASKAAIEALASLYRTQGLKVSVVRSFNIIGPGQSAAFAVARFAQQIATTETGTKSALISTGPLGAVRDFLDVRDAVEAYVSLVESSKPDGIYNLCSGIPRGMREVLDALMDVAGLRVRVQEEPSLSSGGPADVPYQCGSPAMLTEAIGWQPKIDFTQTLQDILDYWRKLAKEVRKA